MIGEQTPARGAFDPDAQHENLVAVDRDAGHLAVVMADGLQAGFAANRRLGQGASRLRLVENAAVTIDPGEVVVEPCRGGARVAVCQRGH